MRSPTPEEGMRTDPEDIRFGGPGTASDAPRYVLHHQEEHQRGNHGTYNYRPTTLEEEAYFGGWLPGARPTGPTPNDLFTIGMRGEPGWDDDPQFNNGASTVTHPPAKGSNAGSDD